MIAGGLALLAGVMALLFPLQVGLAVTVIVGGIFLLVGVTGLFAAFSLPSWGVRIAVGIMPAIFLLLGISLLADPSAGLVSLTVLAGILFLLSGVGRIMLARRVQGPGYWGLLLTGALSVLLAFLALFYPADSGQVLIGTLIAIELLSAGSSLVVLGLSLRNMR